MLPDKSLYVLTLAKSLSILCPLLCGHPCHPVSSVYYPLLLHSLSFLVSYLEIRSSEKKKRDLADLSQLSFVLLPLPFVKVIHRRRGDPHPRCSDAVSVSGRSHRVLPWQIHSSRP